jgi:hypothetical protein
MGIFRRRKEEETLNEQMLREAGIEPDGDTPLEQNSPNSVTSSTNEPEPAEETGPPEPLDPYAGSYPADATGGIVPASLDRAMARPAVWDVVTTATAAGLAGDRVEFATLPSGDVIVDTETGDADLSPLADAVEKQLEPPYRVLARREDGDLWSIAARTIDVVQLSFDGGDEIELVENEGSTELRVDGKPWNEQIPELERAGETLGTDFVVQADRLDGDLWEIRASAL